MNLFNWAVMVITYCTGHNPHWMPETHTQFPQKLVWAGIDRILDPVLLDGNLDGATYLTLPALAASFPNPLDSALPDKRIW
jgi:hypothetical protein